MRKTDKKHENKIRIALTQVCESSLKDISGFNWLTHTINYQNFPQSLHVTCVFADQESIRQYQLNLPSDHLRARIVAALDTIGIRLKNPQQQITLVAEANVQLPC
jgi:hypothetical protein